MAFTSSTQRPKSQPLDKPLNPFYRSLFVLLPVALVQWEAFYTRSSQGFVAFERKRFTKRSGVANQINEIIAAICRD